VSHLLLIITFGLVLLLAACGGEEEQTGSCGETVTVAKQVYIGSVVHTRRPLPPVSRTVRGHMGCVGGDVEMTVRQGIPASVAVFPRDPHIGLGEGSFEHYIRRDSLPALRDHPLHHLYYGSADRPDARDDRRCTTARIGGEVSNLGSDDVEIRDGEKTTEVAIEATSDVRGPELDGVPRVPVGAHVEVIAWRCAGKPRLVARSLTVA
jgi:hypothetical protein